MSVEGRPLDDATLVLAAKAGDVGAYEQLVRAYSQVALRVAYLVLGDHAEAEDAVQEGFLKAYRALDRFRTDGVFRPWLLTIVRNEALNRRRRAGRQARLQLRMANDPVSGDAAPSPENVVVADEDRRSLLRAVDDLGERYRQVIGLRFLVGLSEEETATALGIARGTVKSRTARAFERLRVALAEGRVSLEEDQL